MTRDEMAARIKVLEGHRDQWRRIAWRLEEELRKHDPDAANAIFEDVSTPRQSEERKEGT